MKLPKPKATYRNTGVADYWTVHLSGTFSQSGWTLHEAYLAWVHSNWTRSRIMRTL